MVPAATPTLPPGNVLALYNSSGVYSDVSGVNYYEDWGGWASAGDYSIPPVVLGYQGVNYGGIGTVIGHDYEPPVRKGLRGDALNRAGDRRFGAVGGHDD